MMTSYWACLDGESAQVNYESGDNDDYDYDKDNVDKDDKDLVCFLGMLMLMEREAVEPNIDERNLGQSWHL